MGDVTTMDGKAYVQEPPSGGNGMDTRLTKLETRIDTILPNLATKGDVSEAKASTVMWLAGVIAASTAIIIAVLTFMLNRAVPVQQQSFSQPAPIIIYPPTNPPASQSPPSSKHDH